MDPYQRVLEQADKFRSRLSEIRTRTKPANGRPWYPYDTMANLWHFGKILTGDRRSMFSDLRGRTVADIGGSDGELSFFMEHMGASRVDLYDNPPTGYNLLDGARCFKRELGSHVNIVITDIDSQFSLSGTYDVALFLGILYHLKNPFYALEKVSHHARRALLSTKITAHSAPPDSRDRLDLNHLPLAYLLGADECNNDATNFWVFTEAGLRRLLDRCGWEITDYGVFGGDLSSSDPATMKGDRRAFCCLRSRRLK